MTTEPFTPHADSIQTAWVLMCQQSRISTQPPVEELEAEFDRFLARVRRDAAREALDGFKAWRGTRQCPATSPPDPCNRPAGHAEPHAYYVPEGERNWEEFDWEDSDTYRDTHYPEETP